MTFDAVVFDPTQVWLEFPESEQTQAWQQSQSLSRPSSCWNAYLNQLCLSTVLSWLREEYAPKATVWPNVATRFSFWEVVNGTAITLDTTRFVLVPTETIDFSELRVPQEWVDIPSWAADYYLAVQVNPDDRTVRIFGYATHRQLKTKGTYEKSERSYCLASDDLIQDLNVLWVARQLCPEETTREAIAPLASLPLAQIENLLQRLGNPAVIAPRLAVPFELWGALLEHGGWRQRLYERRIGLPEQWSIFQWLRAGVSDLAQQVGWGRSEVRQGFERNIPRNKERSEVRFFSMGARGEESTAQEVVLSRQLLIAGQHYELRVLHKNELEENIWRFELRSSTSGLIPGGFKLRLLTEDLQAFENNEDVAATAQDQLYIEVSLAPGEGLVWETEPLSENYDREILRF